jgi:hypothetical protein
MIDRRAMSFLWDQSKKSNMWLLVLMGVMCWYIWIWQQRIRDVIKADAASFMKDVYRAI